MLSRRLIILLTPVFLLSFLFLLTSSVFAQPSEEKDAEAVKEVVLEADEVVDKDYFAGGEVVRIFGIVNGDAYVAGGQVTFDGVVNGDLLVAGGQVNISGEVTQDVRVVGGQVIINADIGRNLTVVGGNVDIAESAKIAGSIAVGAGNLNLNAPVGGDVNAGVGNLVISSEVAGDVTAGASKVSLNPKAVIGGDFEYWSEEEANIATGAVVTGEVTKMDPKTTFKEFEFDEEKLEESKKAIAVAKKGIGGVFKAVSFVSALIVGLLLVTFYPKYSQEVVSTLSKRPLASLGVGLVAVFITPFAILLLLVTVIGMPLAFILFAGYLIYFYLAKIAVALWLGKAATGLINKKMRLGWMFVLGLVILYVFRLIPVISVLVWILTLLFGLGAMLLACKVTYDLARKKEVV